MGGGAEKRTLAFLVEQRDGEFLAYYMRILESRSYSFLALHVYSIMLFLSDVPVSPWRHSRALLLTDISFTSRGEPCSH